MSPEFKKIMRHAGAISGADRRKYYSDFDEAPSNGEVAKAVKGIQGEVSDQLAYTMAATELLVSIKQSLVIIAIATSLIAGVAVRYALVNNFWN